MPTLNVLAIHGVGHGDLDPNLEPSWTKAITDGLAEWDVDLVPSLKFLRYDDLFARAPHNPLTYAKAFAKLLASGVVHGIGDLFARERALFEIPAQLRWTAGMVAQWASDDDLREEARKAISAEMANQEYDLICAHSLGTLIAYDTFCRDADLIASKVFISFGSQIGNPFVRDMFAGRIAPINAQKWYHLFNPEDHVLTAGIRLNVPNFLQVGTEFDVENDPLNHDPVHYLSHPNTKATVWREISGARVSPALTRSIATFHLLNTKPVRRALLIGINDYPDPANRLEGCVNDVFLISSLLQECRFAPEDIRVVLNERATAASLMERLHWLLDDIQKDDQRVLFYSGHGAQMPAYGATDEVDHFDECLVPYDFDWSADRAITDKQFANLYSQLPYDSHFVAIFDCCHAGGLSRDGAFKVRGLNPPDDIRHRSLRWNVEAQMWEQRAFESPNPTLKSAKDGEKYLGDNGSTYRLGRAIHLRTLKKERYDKQRNELDHCGPYLPIIMEACREDQLASEYRHGAVSYGAFTFSLAEVLRSIRAKGKNPSFSELSKLVADRLRAFKFNQTPCLVGAKAVIKEKVPWFKAEVRKKRANTSI